MSEKRSALVEVNIACLMEVIRFLKLEMTAAERAGFVEHTRSCPDCQEFITAISVVLFNKDSILKQLETGGFCGQTQGH